MGRVTAPDALPIELLRVKTVIRSREYFVLVASGAEAGNQAAD